jgi:hypothetical protein
MKAIMVFEDDFAIVFDETPKAIRQRATLTQQEIGKRLGIPQSNISNFERKFADYFRLLADRQGDRGKEGPSHALSD